MFEYGALFGDSARDNMRAAWQNLTNFFADVPFYWVILALFIAIIMVRFLFKK